MPATTKIDRFILIAVLSTSIHNMINNKAENIIGLGIITIIFLLAFSVILFLSYPIAANSTSTTKTGVIFW
ncbi:MAG TPA: hypothetical protein VFI70_02045 [Nitrososphaeraceae archaeon]|nr:hypothetical protein [Nitrososphaeraceae archaeon]